MSTKQVEILFICGSPRSHTSEALLGLLEQGARDAGARSKKFLLSKKWIAPCLGCGWCEKTGTCIQAKEGSRKKANDDYLELLDALSYADALAVVSPLFFAGPPAQLKALYDRMQPFWSQQYLLGVAPPVKRPAQLFILGGGTDAHGHEPLVTISRSALAVAGFSIEKVQNFIGFKHPRDVASLPPDADSTEMIYGEAARIRKQIAQQQEFEQRALAAGSAFARFVGNTMMKNAQGSDTELVDEDQSSSGQDSSASGAGKDVSPSGNKAGSSHSLFSEDNSEPQLKIIDSVDSNFEALKQAARASKSSHDAAQESGLESEPGRSAENEELQEQNAQQGHESAQKQSDAQSVDASREDDITQDEDMLPEQHIGQDQDTPQENGCVDIANTPDKGDSQES